MNFKKWMLLLFLVAVCGWGHALPAKNVIWVIGDGMGPEILGFWAQGVRYTNSTNDSPHISHTENLMNQAVWGLYFNNTYDTVVTDSAASATQMATGRFSRPLFVGLDYEKRPVDTLLERALQHGKAIGVVTDTYVTDATPAAFTAHVESRRQREEIARQQLALGPQVILGGGLKYFNKGENKELLRQAQAQGYQVVQNKKQLAKITSGKVLGLFADEALPMAVELHQYPKVPSLITMAQKAISLLEPAENGFIVMIEAGKIDWAAHGNDPGATWAEMKQFDQLIAYLTQYVQAHPDTLLYINADHDTGLGGFAYRHVGKENAAKRTAQGEVLYGKDTDYGSFRTYELFDKQTRSLYLLEEELKNLPVEKRTPALIQKKLSQALGYDIDITQFENLEDVPGIFRQLNDLRAISYATKNHSAAPLLSLAYGADAEQFGGVYHNTDILPRLMRVLGWEGK